MKSGECERGWIDECMFVHATLRQTTICHTKRGFKIEVMFRKRLEGWGSGWTHCSYSIPLRLRSTKINVTNYSALIKAWLPRTQHVVLCQNNVMSFSRVALLWGCQSWLTISWILKMFDIFLLYRKEAPWRNLFFFIYISLSISAEVTKGWKKKDI